MSIMLNGPELAVVVRARNSYRCAQCDMTEAEHHHHFGEELSIVLQAGEDFSTRPECYTTRCLPCFGQQDTFQVSETHSPLELALKANFLDLSSAGIETA